MNKEIKEILNYMKQYVENIYEHDSEPMLNWKDLKIVLDYITNLQEGKNKYYQDSLILSQELTNLQEEIDRLNKECDTYMKIATKKQQRIEKAIEYANTFNHNVPKYKLLNILEGKDNE